MFEVTTDFQEVYNACHNKSMLTLDRLLALWHLVKSTNDIEGDIAELGCHAGGTSYLMASAMVGKKLHAFDSFEGLSALVPEDATAKGYVHYEGDLKTNRDPVIKYLSVFPDVIVYPGYVEDTLQNVKDKKFSLVYLDMNIYTPTKYAIEFMWPRLVKGGYMIFDDYNWEATPGINKAVNGFFSNIFNYNHYYIYPQLGIKKS